MAPVPQPGDTASYGKHVRSASSYAFDAECHRSELLAIYGELSRLERLDERSLYRIARRHPKAGRWVWSKSELIRGLRQLGRDGELGFDPALLAERLRMKPIRTLSGVAPVTVLTQPYPCPGRCIFCPSDVRMPKSYLAEEPGAQRAARLRFDPYAQSFERLRALHHIGHPVDKVELIILGGTWTHYPPSYRRWFVSRCFEALNDFGPVATETVPDSGWSGAPPGRDAADDSLESYNRRVGAIVRRQLGPGLRPWEGIDWESLARQQRRNETAAARCVGLAVETRPDALTLEEVVEIRRLGATKVQIGYQSLSDRVLRLNRRGHDVAAIRRAMALLRGAGFKVHAHWMPNLVGSTPAQDLLDFERIFGDRHFRPDELKIYPCSLIESAELMSYYRRGEWRPYSHDELLELLTGCLRRIPPYCRLTRMIRDIPSQAIVAGNQRTNFRELAEAALRRSGARCRDIRSREIGRESVDPAGLRLETLEYDSGIGRERFLQYVTESDRIAAFLRLSLPAGEDGIPELRRSALLREVHVYGAACGLGERSGHKSQHLGLGRRLVERAARLAAAAGYRDLAVIAAVGTRDYYRRLGFRDGELYQHLELAWSATTQTPLSTQSGIQTEV
ncbi:MAG TPA: tRNA uridine(34) 5-carboxymethylaminomethyl modification radical SAM/GNAT enzyme Elp3 [Acidobacteriota bacterium]